MTFAEPLPPAYTAIVTPDCYAAWWISAKTTYGFTVNLESPTAQSAGTFDVTVFAL